MVTFIPTGGLCDRITTIESFISIARRLNQPKMKMVWLLNNELNCKFEYILNPIPGIEVKNTVRKSHKRKLFYRIQHKAIKLFKQRILKEYFLDLYALTSENKFQFTEEFLKNNNYKGTISGLLMSLKNDEYFDMITPIGELQTEIDKIALRFQENTIGVHIRRTDNLQAIQNSPTELFFKQMDIEIRDDNNVNFFISTDSVEELEKFMNNFGERILYQKECIRNRISELGIKSAVIDLFLLSKTAKIIGSDWSAFSSTAAKLGNIDLIKIKRQ